MTTTLQQFSTIIGAQLPDRADKNAEVSALLTDSRTPCESSGSAFMALRTNVNDGHRYLRQVYDRGVRYFVIDRPEAAADWEGAVFMTVASVTEALQKLGSWARKQFQGRMIAVTGSRGKTEAKEIIYRTLCRAGIDAWHSPRSWNSQIGVPLALWLLPQHHTENTIAVIEAGIDGPGQMSTLAEMIKPDECVLTTMASDHAAGFQSEEVKFSEKVRLIGETACSRVYTADIKVAAQLRTLFPKVQIVCHSADDYRKAYGAIALDICSHAGAENLAEADLGCGGSRIEVNEGRDDTLSVTDLFTPDIDSLAEALDFACRRRSQGQPLRVILGDMMYPQRRTKDVEAVYRRAAELMATAGVDSLVTIGKETMAYGRAFDPAMLEAQYDTVADFESDFAFEPWARSVVLVKGEPQAGFRHLANVLEAPRHDTTFEINLDAIVHNFNYYRSLLRPETGIIAMVKASAYGTGAVEVARTLQSQGAAYLAVAVVDEGVALRQAGITMPIIVLNPVTANFRALFGYRLEPSAFSPDELSRLIAEGRRHNVTDYPVHIKLDTGMHRVGFRDDEIEEAAKRLTDGAGVLSIATAFSHLATADCLDMDDYTMQQLHDFEAMTAHLAHATGAKFRRHILNTAGIERFADYQFDLVRPGIGLYGIDPLGAEGHADLRTVATLTTTIIALKHWPAGTPIGYGGRGVTQRDSVIATVPIGYADGVDRRLGCGRASMIVNGVACKTIGNVCMDLCMLDVTDANAAIGDRVEVFGAASPVEKLATTLETIPYELLTSVSPRVRRIYFRE